MYNQFKSTLSKSILPILLLFILSITGCGSKPTNPANSNSTSNSASTSSSNSTSNPASSPAPSQTAKPVPKPGAVTYQNYLNIKFNTTYDDVKKILGDGLKDDLSANIIDYKWDDQGKTITLRTLNGKIVSKSQFKLGKTTANLTEDQFKKIKKDMTFAQIVAILGPDYQEISTRKSDKSADITRLVGWIMPNSKSIKVELKNDKVVKAYDYLKK